jgi:urea transport system permease protein
MRHLFRLLVLCLVLLPGVAMAALEDAAALFSPGKFSDTEKAIEATAASGDPRGAAILQALLDGNLVRAKDTGRLLIEGGGGLVDALDGSAVVDPGDTVKIRINNKLRGLLRAAIGRFGLESQDPAQRLAAVDGALRDRSPEARARIEAALAKETDPRVKDALAFAASVLALSSDDKPAKLQAITALAGSLDPRARQILGERAGDPSDPEIQAAAQAAIDAIERQRFWLELAVNLYQGISLGSILLLAAMGLAITFGVMGVINMAHGEMLMLGAYSAFVVQELFRAFLPPGWIDLYLVAALPVAALVAGTAGLLVERGVIRFLYGRPLETLLATWGLSLILQQLVRAIFGPTNREVANPSWMTGGIELVGGAVLTWNRLVIIVFCFAVLAVVWLILQRSRFGLEMRAVTQNRRMAAAMGIDTGRVDALTFALGSAVAGLGGVALSQVGNVSPNLGTLYIVDSFMVVVFGGVGQLAGTLTGAMSLGIVNKLLEPFAGAVLGKVIVLIAIILFIQKRPQGLFVLKGRSAEA